MTYWPAGGSAYPFFPGFFPAALPHFMHPPLAGNCYRRTPKPNGLPKDFPDYLVYVTREALVAATTSLGKASCETHDAMLRVNQFLAYERMMSHVPGMSAFGPFPATTATALAALSTTTAAKTVSPFAYGQSAPKARTPATTQSALAAFPGTAASASALTSALSLAAAFLNFSPMMAPAKALV